MGLIPSFFKNKKSKRSCSWKWRTLKQLKTISFYVKAKMFKNNANFAVSSRNSSKFATVLDHSWSQSRCFSSLARTVERDQISKSRELLLQNAVQAIKTKRLFFEPTGNTNSILGSARFPFQDCVAQAIETSDPYAGYRVSMEEIAEAYGLVRNSNVEKDSSECLEGLLSWYLTMNEKKNHGFIIEAFIDMYAGLPSCSNSCYFSFNASASSSKSKDWWEININESSTLRGES
ncbi:hypothetical protein TIFTF001_030234 [Ficus carica]|uniref:Transcription repressor n=1 Tax=Ficus carica TaxID=3494 RepID=A0AA88DTU0_FICCA|nr:hypothetical protein TIFTF001_030234 [Ficus carica]